MTTEYELTQEDLNRAIEVLSKPYHKLTLRAPNFNPERLQHAIDTLEDVIASNKSFDLGEWIVQKEDNACGTTACMMGWIAMTPEWKEAGGMVDAEDSLIGFCKNDYRGYGSNAAAHWFGVSTYEIEQLILPLGGPVNMTNMFKMLGLSELAARALYDIYDDTVSRYSPSQVTVWGELIDYDFDNTSRIKPELVRDVLIRMRDKQDYDVTVEVMDNEEHEGIRDVFTRVLEELLD